MYFYLLSRKNRATPSNQASRVQEGIYFILLCFHNIYNLYKAENSCYTGNLQCILGKQGSRVTNVHCNGIISDSLECNYQYSCHMLGL